MFLDSVFYLIVSDISVSDYYSDHRIRILGLTDWSYRLRIRFLWIGFGLNLVH